MSTQWSRWLSNDWVSIIQQHDMEATSMAEDERCFFLAWWRDRQTSMDVYPGSERCETLE